MYRYAKHISERKTLMNTLVNNTKTTDSKSKKYMHQWPVMKRQFSKAIKYKFHLPKYYILSDEYGGGMVSIIFIYLAFLMGQQPYIPEDSSQMVVPSWHWYFSSGEKTSPEVLMRPLLLNAVSACCEGTTLLTFGSIPAVPSRQRLSVLLTNGMACTRNTDEYRGLTHNCLWVSQIQPTGQQEW